MTLKFYNTLSRQVEKFEPIIPGKVTFYSCGPTVYDFAHIGNFRSFLAADLLRRYLEFAGYDVRHVMNITDVGHMVDDAVADGGGQDKMESARDRLKEAKKSGSLPSGVDLDPENPFAIAEFYAQAFIDDSKLLGMKVVEEAETAPELLPRPTQYIQQMIALVQRLIDTNHAYVGSDGVVYFDIQSFPNYGKLSGNTPDSIRSGAGGRVNDNTQAVKKHPADFMLWKPDPTHLMRWESPWGEGYPGWHLECSVMASDLLAADTNGVIDIHSGGEDNLFPHHECELAQSCAASGSDHFARYWFHPRHLFVEGGKMSKSKGNFFTIRDLVDKGHEPAAIRLELIRTHYRSNANFTFQGLKDSARMVKRWRTFVDTGNASDVASGAGADARAGVEAAFRTALDSDLNIAGAIGAINKWMGDTATPSIDDAALMQQFDKVLCVLDLAVIDTTQQDDTLDVQLIEDLISQRVEARANRDFARADEIRDQLAAMGVEIKDSVDGTTWSKKVD